jgi:hypothetical protein
MFDYNFRTLAMEKEKVLQIIRTIIQKICSRGNQLNERYLHHYFSHLLQVEKNILDLTSDNPVILHTEWPTYKKKTDLRFGRYQKLNGQYLPSSHGTAGFIDFALGDYQKPEIGIEFSLKYSWSHEEVVYDFLKLMDSRNPFVVAISCNIVFRDNGLCEQGKLARLIQKMDAANDEAFRRLGSKNICGNNRQLYYIVTEVSKYNERRHWHCDQPGGNFVDGL